MYLGLGAFFRVDELNLVLRQMLQAHTVVGGVYWVRGRGCGRDCGYVVVMDGEIEEVRWGARDVTGDF